ncbi:PEP3 [Candida theae]|uniref:PEP3 n=1 Tax=Candida theae TaxID=1198502 RepID=A0AAD5BC09_9ASCO|nr:PEP3 [Candida theae]KAI5950671.1 PEP3 [Candida theae]
MNGSRRMEKTAPSVNGSTSPSTYTAHSLDQQQISIYNNLQKPSFEVKPVQLQFDLLHALNKLLVANSQMYLFVGDVLYKIDLNNPSKLVKFTMPLKGGSFKAWVDPTAQHLIVRIDQQYFYLHKSYKSFKLLPKLKGMDVEALAFASSSTIVMATTAGYIYLSAIKPHDDAKKSDIQHLKHVHTVESQVRGIAVTENQSLINIITRDAIYTWSCFDTSFNELSKVFKTQPVMEKVGPSDKWVLTTSGNKYVYIGKDVATNDDEIQFSTLNDTIDDIILTPHHLIGYHGKQVFIYNKLSQESKVLNIEEHIRGIASDATSYWIYTKDSIYEIVISNESSLVWYDYYKMNKFEEALNCLEDSEENFFKRDLVLIKQGYDYLQRGGFGLESSNKELINLQKKGIGILARSTEPFEKVCLMLNSSHATGLLIDYLLVKFAINRKNRVRVVVLSTWIIELMTRTNDERFYEFVKKNHKQLDRSIYNILSGERALFYAETIDDYQFILKYQMSEKNWPLAEKALIKVYSRNVDEVYNHASAFLLNHAKIIDTWLKFDLDYERLLPAILAYCEKNRKLPLNQNAAIKFLLKVHDKGYKSKQLNNYYLSLLITHHDDANHLIIKFINHETAYDQNFIQRLCLLHHKVHPAVLIYIDMGLYEQALEVSLKNNAIELGELVLGKYEEIAEDGDKSEDDNKLEKESYSIRRHLWLTFAKHLIDRTCEGKQAGLDEVDSSSNKLNATLSYIQRNSPLGLKDLLPLFPETVTINNFRDEIVDSLNEYKRTLQDINMRIQENHSLLTTLKQEALDETQKKSEHYSVIKPGSTCYLCHNLLATKKFIFFDNCQHGFHKECLVRYNLKSKGNYNFKKLYQSFIRNQDKDHQEIKSQIDDMLCKECILCNESSINEIDIGYLEENDRDIDEIKDWEL